MNRILKVLFFLVVGFSLILSSWLVLHSDIQFTSEIARDFLLLDELNTKKIVLIGPSSSTGLFHGPLWSYVNYPAYGLSNGNPIAVGYSWIVLIIIFITSGFFIARKLFDTKTAYFFTAIMSVYCVYISRTLYNPHGAFFLLPVFFFFFILYIQTLKIKYLVLHILVNGAMIQFQMAIGIPFLILSFLYILFISIKSKKIRPIFSYLLVPLTLSNFIVFDLRHDSLLSKITLSFLTSAGRDHPNFIELFYQRLKIMTTGVEFIRVDDGYKNMAIFVVFIVLVYLQIKHNRHKRIYLSFLYFYFGYLLVSMLNSGSLLYFYFFPVFPLLFLVFSSLVTSRYGKAFTFVFIGILFFNIQTAFSDVNVAMSNSGKTQESWKFMKNSAQKLFSGKENKFGYFAYSPDSVAYREKYALEYARKRSEKNAYYFQKKTVTYIFAAPPPINQPFMKEDWWIKNQLHITKKPSSETLFDNGYKIIKFSLTKDEIDVLIEPNIDPGLTFR